MSAAACVWVCQCWSHPVVAMTVLMCDELLCEWYVDERVNFKLSSVHCYDVWNTASCQKYNNFRCTVHVNAEFLFAKKAFSLSETVRNFTVYKHFGKHLCSSQIMRNCIMQLTDIILRHVHAVGTVDLKRCACTRVSTSFCSWFLTHEYEFSTVALL